MRKHFLDNLRYAIVLLVIFHHVFYLFNSVGVITNVAIPGIPALDVVEYVLYPWFMVALFAISGACARYSLENQSGRAYLKSKLRRQLLPSVAGIFILGWVSGWVTSRYTDMFGGMAVPGLFKYLICCMAGIGPLWFLHQLLLAEVVLVLLRKLDRGDRLWKLGGKLNIGELIFLAIPFWGSAQILNMPLIEVYRCGIYIFSFLAGYYIFSHEHIQTLLAKWVWPLLAAAGVLAVAYTWHFWGKNYSEMGNLKHLLTNLYAWTATLAALGLGKRYLDRETAFTRFLAPRSFGFYVLHYPLLAVLALGLDKGLHLPVAAMYPALLTLEALLLPPITDLIRRIPILKTLLLGESGAKARQ